jgi:hypothetical protein
MRAVLRLTIAMFAGGLWLGPSLAFAQSAGQPTTNTPATDTIGPRELQNFNLNGTVTRTADTPPPAPSTRVQTRQPSAPTAAPVAPREAKPQASARPSSRTETRPAANPGQTSSMDLPPAGTASATLPGSAPEPGFGSGADSTPATLAPEQKLSLWPLLLLAAVVGAAAAFLLWRRRAREALADGPSIDAYVAPEPTPAPRAAPPPAPKPAAPPIGIVSTRLRPWVDIAFVPLGCIVDDERVTIEFDVQLHNSGSGLARDILVEASMFNAGPTQDQDIGRFFADPVGQGERIEVLPPLQSVTIRTSLVAPRVNIQLFELAGRHVFVPLVAFNVLYRWSGGRGQTSLGYLLGRETKGEKLGPLRLDLGPRAFTKLGIRALPTGLRK